jgi:transcriptional regulator with XRE-family HTH domain
MAGTAASNDLSRIVAANIRAARLAEGLTQHALAVRLGRGDQMTVSRWERGEHRPSDESLVRLAAALDREFAWFFTDHAEAAA